jgi:hypothetical protein
MGDTTVEDGVAGPNGTTPEAVTKSTAYKSPGEASELLRADAGDIAATTVTLDRSGAERITAERVALDQSGARTIEARSAQLDRSGAVLLTAERAALNGSSAVVLRAGEVRVVRSKAVVLWAGKTTVEGEVRTLVHVGEACAGVRPVFDGRGALRFGAALGGVLLVGGKVLGRVLGRG